MLSIDENSMKNFCDINCLKHLIKVSKRFKNPGKPACIAEADLGLLQHPRWSTLWKELTAARR